MAKNFRLVALATLLLAGSALAACGGGATVGGPIPPGNGGGASPTPAPGSSKSPTPSPSPSSSGGSTTNSSCTAAAANIPFPAATDADPFYAQPCPFPAVAHGTILDSRMVTYAPNNTAMTNQAWEVKFASQDIHGNPIAAMETVIKPLNPTTGTMPLFVEAIPEDGLGAVCAPTHYTTGSTTDGNDQLYSSGEDTALAAGWTVAVPDIEGPYSLYAVGRQEGMITLDAEIAALAFAPLGLNAKTPIGAAGYSGGAHAVSWAAAEQVTYAPQLNLVGTASGGTPADLLGILEAVDGTSAEDVASNEAFFDIIYMSMVGINRAYPDFFTPILNSAGVAAATAMENGCVGKNSAGSSAPNASGHFSDYVTVGTNVFMDPHVTQGAAVASEPQPGLYPKTNMFIYQSAEDELIPADGVDKLVNGWCADGTTIEYYRATSGGDHVTMYYQNVSTVQTYMQERFSGLPLTLPAGQTTNCN